MIEFRDFMLGDLAGIDIQPSQQEQLERTLSSNILLGALCRAEWAWTATKAGEPIAIAGCTAGQIWMLLAKDLRRETVPIYRHMMASIKADGRTLRARVDKDNENAIRLVRMAGFKPENHGFWVYDANMA